MVFLFRFEATASSGFSKFYVTKVTWILRKSAHTSLVRLKLQKYGDNVRKIELCSCEIKDFYAPQGCFQSLKLTSSLRDCGHRHGAVSALGTSSTLLPACFTHLVPFSFFSNSVGVRKKLQKVRYPLCPPVLNGLPSRAPHTNAFALLAKFALRTRARLTQVCYFLCFDILAF